MNKFTIILAVALIGVGSSAMATSHTKTHKSMDMKMVDTNSDGMISKEEFMKHHEMMYDEMKKNKAGMVDMKEMEMMQHNMDMKHKGKAMDKDHMMKKDGMAK